MEVQYSTGAAAWPTAQSAPEMGTRTARVLLVDDHELVRCGVRSVCSEIPDVRFHWIEASTLQDGIDAYRREGPLDAVLLDLNLSDCKGLQGLRFFLREHPGARVAVFSGTQDEFVVRQARAMGAAAFLGKGGDAHTLRSALLGLLNAASSTPGHAKGTPSTALFPRFPSSAVYDRVAELGARHLEILELVLSGCTNQEISSSTGLSLGTIKNYVSSLLLALDVRSRSHLISLFH